MHESKSHVLKLRLLTNLYSQPLASLASLMVVLVFGETKRIY